MISIIVETTGQITGRNRTTDLAVVIVSESCDGDVLIDGAGKDGIIADGGLHIERVAMDKLAIKWLVERRFGVRYPKNWEGNL